MGGKIELWAFGDLPTVPAAVIRSGSVTGSLDGRTERRQHNARRAVVIVQAFRRYDIERAPVGGIYIILTVWEYRYIWELYLYGI
jgi:hypothetical protein